MRVKAFCLFLSLVGASTVALPAHAFENQWHFGGGLGAGQHTRFSTLGPALGAHAAYGLSDMFDLRLELRSARFHPEAERVVWLHTGELGITYKLDLIQLIPFVGLAVGGTASSRAVADSERWLPVTSVLFGADYALDRQIGLGLLLFMDMHPTEPKHDAFDLTMTHALLRGEYRFGW